DVAPGLAPVVTAQEAADLDADVHRLGPRGVEGDLLGVSDVRRSGEAPAFNGGNGAQFGQLLPAVTEVIAEKEPSRLTAQVDAGAAIDGGRFEAINFGLAEAGVGSLPGGAAVA